MSSAAVQKSSNLGANNASSNKLMAFNDKAKPLEVRRSNIIAAKSVADFIRTSLGPKGMDKMIQTSTGEVIITNDGATILKHIGVLHPAARMLVNLSAAQDIEAGDGTTSVVVLAGAFLTAAEKLLQQGIHPTTIADSFIFASKKAVEILNNISIPVQLTDVDSLKKAATTALCSKVVSQYSSLLAPMAVDAVLKVINSSDPNLNNVDIRDIRVIKKLGGTIDETEMFDGLVLTQSVLKSAGGPSRIEKARVALLQFQLSPPKTDMENQIVVKDYKQMDKILKEERAYILNICKKIKKTGANVLLIQKSILRDAVSELALHFLSKLKIMCIKDIERNEIDFICKSINCKPIADSESFVEEKLGYCDVVEEVNAHGSKYVRFISSNTSNNTVNIPRTVSIIVRGANNLVLEEAERSLHDALCVIRCLVKKRALIAGGGAPEIEVACRLSELSRSLSNGPLSHCVAAYADALEVIPVTLAENAGLNPINIVTELRKQHSLSDKNHFAGINVRRGSISNVVDENVLQPLLVSTSSIELASDTVRMILKIDDIVACR